MRAVPEQEQTAASLTLEDIAKLAGVSRSTVSRVVNEQPNVRNDVRQRVLDVIQTTGYQPNAAARALASQRSWTLGMILPHSVSFFFTDPYYPHLTKGIAQACNQHDYTLAFFLVGSKEDEEKIFPRVSRRGLLDGVLVQSGHHGDQEIISHLLDANIPLVVVGRPFRYDNVSYIDIDNVNASFNAVGHLMRLGYQRIGTITGPPNSTVGIDRKKGYLKALTERGREIDEALIVEGDFTETGGYYAMQKLLSSKPDAVFAASDIMAIGAMRAVRDAGLAIPDDIAFVGFDDLPIATFSDAKLTTMRQSVVEFGEKSVELLIDLIENGSQTPHHIILDTELVIRDTCGAKKRN
ncbi:MAG: LacI family transcriptional regulator [Chloroflexi bacterium]|nr:MAG: LacI family transcriptional regulator [Chloroflexota bacterium]MBL1194159.1 LacI family transcriptional regulator [Chloroflexota bacterium]NOH11451.1 LacI family DNA-binding transcriptional regulator [Chloroflexota bacterium]